MSRLREGRIGRPGVADLAGEGEVVGAAGPEAGRVARHRGPSVRHRGQRLVVHLDELARVGSERGGLGHDQRDRFAAIANGLDGEGKVRGHRHLEAFRQAELGVGRTGPIRVMGDGPHPIGGCVRPRQDREYAGERCGPGGVDRAYPRVSVRRPHHEGAGRAGGRRVVGEPAPTGQQTPVFHPRAGGAHLAGGTGLDAGTGCHDPPLRPLSTANMPRNRQRFNLPRVREQGHFTLARGRELAVLLPSPGGREA